MIPSTPASIMALMSSVSLAVQVNTKSPSSWASATRSGVTSMKYGHQRLPPASVTAWGIETPSASKSGATDLCESSPGSSSFSGNCDRYERGMSGATRAHSLRIDQSKLCRMVRCSNSLERTSSTTSCTIARGLLRSSGQGWFRFHLQQQQKILTLRLKCEVQQLGQTRDTHTRHEDLIGKTFTVDRAPI